MAITGRPTKYSQALAEQICFLIAGGKTLRQVAGELSLSTQVVNNWLNTNEEFLGQYARAKEQAMEDMADEILEIADDGSGDRKMEIGRDGKEYEVVDNEALQRSRLRVDTRKWLMSKLAPKRFGERIQQDLINSDGSLAGLTLAQLKSQARGILSEDGDE